MYLIEKYELSYENTLLIGDRKLDIVGAKNAGLKTFYLQNTSINITGCDFVGESLKKVLELI
ncbi:HAD hydrolase-like protein [Natronospora cellulosivora (SeqCode)]